jgi:ribosomal protein S27AE
MSDTRSPDHGPREGLTRDGACPRCGRQDKLEFHRDGGRVYCHRCKFEPLLIPRSPDLDARLSEDVQKGARVLSDRYAWLLDTYTIDEDPEPWLRTAGAVLSAANHAERLAELERARLWIGYAMEELTAEQITRVTERAEYEGESLLDRVRVLEEALEPFADLAATADKFGQEPGSTCPWRLEYNDIDRARRALASSLETDTEDGGRDGTA